MTTEIKILSSLDVFSDNDVVSLDRSKFPSDFRLCVIEWTTEMARSPDAFSEVLRAVFTRVAERLKDYDFWLLTGNSVWQEDTKIVRYRKLFNALKAQGMDFESASERFESVVEQDGKLKFFGAVRLDASIISIVHLTMRPGSCTYIVARTKNSEWQFPLSLGWSGNWRQDSHLIAAVTGHDGIVFQRVGYFDDPETGLAALTNPSVLERIVC